MFTFWPPDVTQIGEGGGWLLLLQLDKNCNWNGTFGLGNLIKEEGSDNLKTAVGTRGKTAQWYDTNF